ncbi:MAG: peptide-methionine (S)-S-oxide reductase [Cyclobacteriaceae bacterium]|jgi:peptide-methionine (S)-S-oxide reductase
MKGTDKVGFGGGCHWCTEGIFLSLIGILKVDQGWIASKAPDDSFSEAVIVYFDPEIIDLHTLINVHLLTHSSSGNHSMRSKYRSAVYYFSDVQAEDSLEIIKKSQEEDKKIITKVLPFEAFKINTIEYLDYLYTRPDSGFCKTYIQPKLKQVYLQYGKMMNQQKVDQLKYFKSAE